MTIAGIAQGRSLLKQGVSIEVAWTERFLGGQPLLNDVSAWEAMKGLKPACARLPISPPIDACRVFVLCHKIQGMA